MVTFRNNNGRRNTFRRNERNFKSNNDRNKFSNNFSNSDNFQRKALQKGHNTHLLRLQNYNDAAAQFNNRLQALKDASYTTEAGLEFKAFLDSKNAFQFESPTWNSSWDFIKNVVYYVDTFSSRVTQYN